MFFGSDGISLARNKECKLNKSCTRRVFQFTMVTTLSTAAQDNEIPGKTLDWLFQRYCSTDFHDEQYVYYCSGV